MRARRETIVALAVIAAAGCGGNGGQAGGGIAAVGSAVDPGRTVAKTIGVEGGAIVLADGAVLTIPQGALESPIEITTTVPTDQTSSGHIHKYVFGPVGTRFKVPASLTLPYDDLPDGQFPDITIYQSSTLNPNIDCGVETTNWNHPRVIGRDFQKRTVTVALEHFTIVYVAIDEALYLVAAIPTKFLSACDVEFWLTAPKDSVEAGSYDVPAGPSWNPAHAGLHIGNEFYPDVERPTDGIHVLHHSFQTIEKTDSMDSRTNGIYLGARRPTFNRTGRTDTLHRNQRAAIVRWAEASTAHTRRADMFYRPCGETEVREGGMTDVSFIVEALAQGDARPMSGFVNEAVSTALDLYHATGEVERIEVEVGDQLQIPLYSVTIDPMSPSSRQTLTSQGWYSMLEPYSFTTVSAPASSTTAPSKANEWLFSWTPGAQDANKTFDCVWETTASTLVGPRTVSRKLQIYVKPTPKWRVTLQPPLPAPDATAAAPAPCPTPIPTSVTPPPPAPETTTPAPSGCELPANYDMGPSESRPTMTLPMPSTPSHDVPDAPPPSFWPAPRTTYATTPPRVTGCDR